MSDYREFILFETADGGRPVAIYDEYSEAQKEAINIELEELETAAHEEAEEPNYFPHVYLVVPTNIDRARREYLQTNYKVIYETWLEGLGKWTEDDFRNKVRASLSSKEVEEAERSLERSQEVLHDWAFSSVLEGVLHSDRRKSIQDKWKEIVKYLEADRSTWTREKVREHLDEVQYFMEWCIQDCEDSTRRISDAREDFEGLFCDTTNALDEIPEEA